MTAMRSLKSLKPNHTSSGTRQWKYKPLKEEEIRVLKFENAADFASQIRLRMFHARLTNGLLKHKASLWKSSGAPLPES
jgi:hypothetical protein